MTDENNFPELYRLFNPRNVAVIGATDHINKIAGQVIYNLNLGGYKGKVFPVNPKYDKVLGKRAYPSVKHIPDPIDLLVSVVPNFKTAPIIEESVDVGVRFILVITAGFQEIIEFDENAIKYQDQIKEALKRAKGVTRMIGPNCMGISSTSVNLNAMMGFLPLAKRLNGFNISITSQSGSWTWNVVSNANSHGVGIANAISNGNELDLKFEDFVEYFGFYDEYTNAIVGFLEGFRNGKKIKKIASEISEKKPIIILKGGKTKSGAKTASSHTGSIAGSYKIFQSFIKQHGIIEAEDSSDLIDLARAIRIFHPNNYPKGNRIAIFTGGGGEAVTMSDILEKYNLQLTELHQQTINKLNTILPPHWPHRNPVDFVGSAAAMVEIKKLMSIIAQDDNVDIIFTWIPIMGSRDGEVPEIIKKIAAGLSGIKKIDDINAHDMVFDVLKQFDRQNVRNVIKIAKNTGKLIVYPTSRYDPEKSHEHEILSKLFNNGILVVRDVVAGARIIKKMLEFKKFLERQRIYKINK
ncbi:MAG: CoA-binding protein [Candidatus Hodarchaeota archaeon]